MLTMEEIKKDKYAPQKRYNAKYTRQIKFVCNVNTEQDILDKLDSIENKNGYIKALIRADIAKNGIGE